MPQMLGHKPNSPFCSAMPANDPSLVADPRSSLTKLEKRILVPEDIPEDPVLSEPEEPPKRRARPRAPVDPNKPKKPRAPRKKKDPNEPALPRKDGKVYFRTAMPDKSSIKKVSEDMCDY